MEELGDNGTSRREWMEIGAVAAGICVGLGEVRVQVHNCNYALLFYFICVEFFFFFFCCFLRVSKDLWFEEEVKTGIESVT